VPFFERDGARLRYEAQGEGAPLRMWAKEPPYREGFVAALTELLG
jgi:hypothetical protein